MRHVGDDAAVAIGQEWRCAMRRLGGGPPRLLGCRCGRSAARRAAAALGLRCLRAVVGRRLGVVSRAGAIVDRGGSGRRLGGPRAMTGVRRMCTVSGRRLGMRHGLCDRGALHRRMVRGPAADHGHSRQRLQRQRERQHADQQQTPNSQHAGTVAATQPPGRKGPTCPCKQPMCPSANNPHRRGGFNQATCRCEQVRSRPGRRGMCRRLCR